jgi:hypothetical protein
MRWEEEGSGMKSPIPSLFLFFGSAVCCLCFFIVLQSKWDPVFWTKQNDRYVDSPNYSHFPCFA